MVDLGYISYIVAEQSKPDGGSGFKPDGVQSSRPGGGRVSKPDEGRLSKPDEGWESNPEEDQCNLQEYDPQDSSQNYGISYC